MGKKEIYKEHPCKLTGRDWNQEMGKYKKLPFVPGAGSLADNCYIRRTKSGFILYKMNGYIQPFFVHAGEINKVIMNGLHANELNKILLSL